MDTHGIQVRKCVRAECGMRFPLLLSDQHGKRCPECGASTRIVLEKIVAPESGGELKTYHNIKIEAMLDNIRSAWNVGSMFRTADGVGIRYMHLCGLTPTPDNPKVTKTSLGAEVSVPWLSYRDGVRTAGELKGKGMRLWALEHNPGAESMLELQDISADTSIVLVVGNEIAGVDPGILELCERVMYLPMIGLKRSYNAAVAFGIAAHYLRFAVP